MTNLHPHAISAFLPSPFQTPFQKRISRRRTPKACTQSFNWTDQWYPVALTTDLNPHKPNSLTLLSTPLVAFRSNQTWVVLHDRCPHRYASLSHGRVTENRLECGYHGWQFAYDGNVQVLPQSPGCSPQSAVSIKSCIIQELLFCTLGNPTKPPDIVQPSKNRFVVSYFSRVLPLCFTTVIQNLLDPAHIHFAHHGTIGRRDQAGPVSIRILESMNKDGFIADYYDGTVTLRFRPPCLVEIVTISGFSFAYYTTPLSQSSSKAFAIRSSPHKRFIPPRWLDHLRRHKLLEDDLAIMQSQQSFMTREQGYHHAWKEFCMPASADKLIVEMRKWLDRFAPKQQWYGCAVVEDHGRWGHTTNCSDCWRVWYTLGILKNGVEALAVGFLLAAAGRASPILACVAGVLAACVRALQWSRRKFE